MSAEGADITFDAYQEAKPYLRERIGGYCSFCERPVSGGLAVEHICAKNEDCSPELALEWTNFVLACVNCNSNKKAKLRVPTDIPLYLLPDRDRTFEAFDYTAGVVRVAKQDDVKLKQRAENTNSLVELSRHPGRGMTMKQIERGSDTRYRDRRQAWQQAREARRELLTHDTPGIRRLVISLAKTVGFWSVWMTEFRDDPQMQSALCEASNFPGTARERL